MKVGDTIISLQELLLIPAEQRAKHVGPLTRGRLEQLASMAVDQEWTPDGMAVAKPAPTLPGVERNISLKGILLVKEFEGCQLTAYKDEAGIWTIGMGHTGLQHNDGTVYAGRTITLEKAEQLFDYDMNQFEHRVTALVKMPLTQDQFDALVSFDFNTGGLTLKGGEPSTLLKALNVAVPQLDVVNSEFMKWNKVNGKVLNGLTRRRMSERKLFNSENPYIVSVDEFNAWKAKQK